MDHSSSFIPIPIRIFLTLRPVNNPSYQLLTLVYLTFVLLDLELMQNPYAYDGFPLRSRDYAQLKISCCGLTVTNSTADGSVRHQMPRSVHVSGSNISRQPVDGICPLHMPDDHFLV